MTTTTNLFRSIQRGLEDRLAWRWDAALTAQREFEAAGLRSLMVPDHVLEPWARKGYRFTLVIERTGRWEAYRTVPVGHFGEVSPGQVVERQSEDYDEVYRWEIVGDFALVAADLVDVGGRERVCLLAEQALPTEVPC